MKLLLTSGGVTNPTIEGALVGLLGRPIGECSALCIPTALYGHPWVGPGKNARDFITGESDHMAGLGWGSVGVLELTALPSIPADRWVPLVRETDVLLAAGGDAGYLAYWMRRSGFGDLVPSLAETVYVGMSGGSMALTPRVGAEFVGWEPPDGEDATPLGLVDFSMFPHLGRPDLPHHTAAAAGRGAAAGGGRGWGVAGGRAGVVDGAVEVVSGGVWHRLA